MTIQNLPDSFVQIWGLTLQILSKSWEKALESAGNRSKRVDAIVQSCNVTKIIEIMCMYVYTHTHIYIYIYYTYTYTVTHVCIYIYISVRHTATLHGRFWWLCLLCSDHPSSIPVLAKRPHDLQSSEQKTSMTTTVKISSTMECSRSLLGAWGCSSSYVFKWIYI